MKSASVTTPKFCPSCRARFGTDALFCPNDGTPLLAAPTSDFPAQTSADAPDPYLGREISGHIEIRALAGVGAMGRVYRAFQKGIDRDVAVKILHRELSANPQLVSRFHREAKVASRLQHPNVVHVHLAGQLPDGALYIVMEYLDGMSLQSALAAAGGAMPLARALHVTLQLCDAVGEAHTQGVVHRDLKPENVMLVRRGQDDDYVKVLDFGIARLSWGEQSMATAAGLIFGTARYISPEGAQGESVGPPGDVYAIATLVYQMLAGRTPFEGDQAVGLLIQQIHDAPPPLRSIPRAAYVPEPIEAAIMKNLAKDRATREPDARSFGRALLDAARTAGMAPEELVGRAFFGPSSSASIRLAPMQATKKHELSPELQARLSPPPPAHGNGAPPPAAGAGAGGDLLLGVPMPSAPTTRWTPPSLPQTPPSSQPSGVETTIDDDDVPPVPPTPPPRTQVSTAAQGPQPQAYAYGHGDGGGGAASYVPQPQPTPAPPSAPPSPPSRPALQTPTPGTPLYPARDSVPPSKPFSNVDTTISDEPRSWARYTAIFFLLFLLGSAGAAAIAFKLGYFDRPQPVARPDELASRAERALVEERWDAPPGENVRDLTSEGLARWPNEPRLVQVRARAARELARKALAAKAQGEVHDAAHFARLATELDPHDAQMREMSLSWDRELSQAPDAAALLFLADAGAGAQTQLRPGWATANPARVTLDATPPKPKLGQPVDFTAKVATSRQVTDAHFALVGPGLGAGAKLAALSDGAAFRAGFTFLEAGKFEVTFNAKVDGAPVRSSRTVVVDPPQAATPPQPTAPPDTTGTAPGPAPTGSVKWL